MDYSYVLLNTLCMPGFFYHFFCLLRSWGLDIDGLTTVSPPSSFMVPEQWLAMLEFNAEVSLSIHPSILQSGHAAIESWARTHFPPPLTLT